MNMDIPNWINLVELVIALILIFNIIGNLPNFVISILGIILIVDVVVDIVSG